MILGLIMRQYGLNKSGLIALICALSLLFTTTSAQAGLPKASELSGKQEVDYVALEAEFKRNKQQSRLYQKLVGEIGQEIAQADKQGKDHLMVFVAPKQSGFDTKYHNLVFKMLYKELSDKGYYPTMEKWVGSKVFGGQSGKVLKFYLTWGKRTDNKKFVKTWKAWDKASQGKYF